MHWTILKINEVAAFCFPLIIFVDETGFIIRNCTENADSLIVVSSSFIVEKSKGLPGLYEAIGVLLGVIVLGIIVAIAAFVICTAKRRSSKFKVTKNRSYVSASIKYKFNLDANKVQEHAYEETSFVRIPDDDNVRSSAYTTPEIANHISGEDKTSSEFSELDPSTGTHSNPAYGVQVKKKKPPPTIPRKHKKPSNSKIDLLSGNNADVSDYKN